LNVTLDKEKGKMQQTLYDFLQGLSNPECKDWSYVTMRSSMAGGGIPNLGLVGIDYPMRDSFYEYNDLSII
jgi:hypothetical protein